MLGIGGNKVEWQGKEWNRIRRKIEGMRWDRRWWGEEMEKDGMERED